MRDKIEADGKAEEKLYNQFMCWATTVIDTKTASNTAANTRMDELKAYIDDISSGRVEFTSERGDLTGEIAALKEATKVLADATAEKGAGAFLEVRAGQHNG